MKRFHLISETDAQRLTIGETVALHAGGRVTPLASDTLRARRIVVVSEVVEDLGGASTDGLRLANDPRRVAIGADHTGVELKVHLVRYGRGRGLDLIDLGVHGHERADYPDVAASVARAVARGEADAGVVIDGSGVGSAVAANKIAGIRAACCTDPALARYAREHTGANVLTLGATLVDAQEAIQIFEAWLETSIQEPRYIRRLLKLHALERTQQ